jgi:uncharacterized membrane protein
MFRRVEGLEMSDVPITVMVAAFQEERAADQMLVQLTDLRKARVIKIMDAAVIRKDEDGTIHIKETADMRARKGAGIGALLGGVVGLVAGPVGLWAGGAAIVGWLSARKDRGFKNERLETVGISLKPESSAIIAVVEQTWAGELGKQLIEAGANLITEALAQEIAAELNAEKEFAITATN